jgi:hypothetical protein
VNDLRFRKLTLDQDVTITLPAHTLLGFLYAYSASDWNEACATDIAIAVRNALFDPVFLKEEEARQQEHADLHKAAFSHFVGQLPIELPPNVTDSPPFGYPGGSDDYPSQPGDD